MEEAQVVMVEPIYDRILVKIDPVRERTGGGLYLPTTASNPGASMGIVVVTGEGRLMDDGSIVPLKVKSGDHVLINRWSGTEIDLDGEKHVIITEAEVLGKTQRCLPR